MWRLILFRSFHYKWSFAVCSSTFFIVIEYAFCDCISISRIDSCCPTISPPSPGCGRTIDFQVLRDRLYVFDSGRFSWNLFLNYDSGFAFYFVSVNSSLNYSTHSPRILKGVISMFQGSSLFQSPSVWA